MAERHQDQQPVADGVAAVTGSSQQLLDLGLGEVLALPVVGVLAATATNCRLYRSGLSGSSHGSV